MKEEKIIVIDFGGQYNQLVARRVRECNVYCEIYSYRTNLQQIKDMNPKGIILTGGPNSCYEEGAPTYTKELFELGIPVLGLCYGAQLMQHVLGGTVEKAPVREYGKTETFVDNGSDLFHNVSEKTIVWMSHFDYISKPAPGFKIVAHTADCPVAAAENTEKKLYAIQFHPEVLHTQEGTKMLENFVLKVCGCKADWKMDAFVENTIEEIRNKVGDGKVLLALSGGVDSSVAAGLLSRAIGKQLTCVFVDHGLLRKDEGDEVENVFGPNGQFDLNFIRVNAQERYYSKLAGVTEPEAKRKIIGEEFIRVFEEEAKKIGAVDFLAQGTIYPDVVESGLGGESAVIKSHHNVGGLPDFVDFKEIIEPLRDLFKDEVRKAGLELGLPKHLVFRQPFPGPGLGIRIIGEVSADKVRIVQDADAIYREEVDKAAAQYEKENGKAPAWMPNQYFAALTNMRSVGVMGDERTYDYAVALRAVNTIDFMTAESAEIPFAVLQTVMSRIINEVRGVNRVFYDLTSKPPGTIEFE
ncbi:MAG: glutamine-hydrolyzing GMP synthase [Candidatus Gastranaerophilaceae bacterium]